MYKIAYLKKGLYFPEKTKNPIKPFDVVSARRVSLVERKNWSNESQRIENLQNV